MVKVTFNSTAGCHVVTFDDGKALTAAMLEMMQRLFAEGPGEEYGQTQNQKVTISAEIKFLSSSTSFFIF